MNIKKRDGRIKPFDFGRIVNAVTMATNDVYGDIGVNIKPILDDIQIKLDVYNKDVIDIEKVQDIILSVLYKHDRKIHKAYKSYREERNLARESVIDKEIEELLTGSSEYWKKENSNKNSTLVTTQRDYLAGIVSKDLTMRRLLPKDVVEAHNEGIIHFHDADYFLQRTLTNCFDRNTEFITDKGVKKFSDFYDGAIVKVLDKDGVWREAIVKNFGKQKLYDVTFKTQKTTKTITCTKNHRWILNDGTVTTDLKVGDKLYGLKNTKDNYEPKTIEEIRSFVYGFILGDGSDIGNSRGVRARLCGHKNNIIDYFRKAGYYCSVDKHGDYIVSNKDEYSKQEFLNCKCWRLLTLEQKIAMFHGYYYADGRKDITNVLATADTRLESFIEEVSALSGYHISSKSISVRDTQYKKNARISTYHFIVSQPNNWLWKVDSIKPHSTSYVDNRTNKTYTRVSDEKEVWCVVEPVTHSFTLAGGIVTGNCELINLEDMLQNGTVINGVLIEKPHRFLTAMTIATQIITAVTSSTYGGATITLTHLAPFVRSSYNIFLKKHLNRGLKQDQAEKFANEDLQKEIEDGVQTFNYQINSMSNTNGQSPFLSVFMYLSEDKEYTKEVAMITKEFFKQRILGLKNEQGVYVTQAFPKLLYVLEEQNINEDGEYYWLTRLGAECTAKRFVPDYISEKKMFEYKENNCFPCMSCRSFLSPWKDENDKVKFYGRFNQGVVSLNLVDVALSSKKDINRFWRLLDERAEICHKALLCRHERLEGTLSDVAPILWQHGAFARLKKGEKIDKLLHGGYSSISLGYVGIYEMTKYMTGESHTTEKGKKFAKDVMVRLNEMLDKWKKEDDIGYALYAVPEESTTYRFAKLLQKRFGIIEGITDKDYVTNSYHVVVTEEIDAFSKLKFEGEFQKLSLGGMISYIEADNLTQNIDAVMQVINCIYDNTMYAEINIKSDYCMKCGYDGEMKIDDNMEWYCPNCGNTDTNMMSVTRRTCGYIGTNYWNKGRTQEIKERYVHLTDKEIEVM